MTMLASPNEAADPTTGFPQAVFGNSADGFAVARVADTEFAMLPSRDGRFYLASGWRIGRPMEQWTHADFYGHSGELANEVAFRAKVMENAEHQREKRALRRREIRTMANTPWGPSQAATLYAEDVVFHSTAGHGGIHLSATRNRMVHPMLRGTILASGESREKDRRAFEQRHAGDWIVVSAITSNHEKGMVEVVATMGGRRGPGTEERRFLVPSEEYRSGPFGFVIDEDRHWIYSGPSSFLGWAR
ncbi:MAG: hypothetical protein B7Y61_14420 [Rhizobiales bacterium 35-66-30]|nr:MAG: hypothetical protein B7Y61_14420 [Rhizobiales bacterium 35-66-30]